MASKAVVWWLFSCYVVSDSLRPHDLQHVSFLVLHYLPEFAQTHVRWMCWWCHPTISSSVTPFSSCPQSFPASGSFPRSWLFASDGQSQHQSFKRVIQCWFPLGLTGLMSLLSKGLSRTFSSTTVRKQWFFGAQPSVVWCNTAIPVSAGLGEKHYFFGLFFSNRWGAKENAFFGLFPHSSSN